MRTSNLILIFAILGLIDAIYLTIKYFSGEAVVCGIIEGCDTVLASQYSKIFEIPVSLVGVGYYAIISGLSFLYAVNNELNILKTIIYITTLGFLASIYFVYLQLFVLETICLYCMASAFISTMLLILSVFIYIQKEKGETLNASTPSEEI